MDIRDIVKKAILSIFVGQPITKADVGNRSYWVTEHLHKTIVEIGISTREYGILKSLYQVFEKLGLSTKISEEIQPWMEIKKSGSKLEYKFHVLSIRDDAEEQGKV